MMKPMWTALLIAVLAVASKAADNIHFESSAKLEEILPQKWRIMSFAIKPAEQPRGMRTDYAGPTVVRDPCSIKDEKESLQIWVLPADYVPSTPDTLAQFNEASLLGSNNTVAVYCTRFTTDTPSWKTWREDITKYLKLSGGKRPIIRSSELPAANAAGWVRIPGAGIEFRLPREDGRLMCIETNRMLVAFTSQGTSELPTNMPAYPVLISFRCISGAVFRADAKRGAMNRSNYIASMTAFHPQAVLLYHGTSGLPVGLRSIELPDDMILAVSAQFDSSLIGKGKIPEDVANRLKQLLNSIRPSETKENTTPSRANVATPRRAP